MRSSSHVLHQRTASIHLKPSKIPSFSLKSKKKQRNSAALLPASFVGHMDDIPPKIPAGDDLPPGRDWEKDVMVGIHAHPSMSHLHVHVLSVDRFSECMKHRKHYNSFATPFFVPLEDFPLAQDDPRRHPGREGYLNSDLKCWRCGRNFGGAFKTLDEHLKEEFEKWKAE
jgi:aprataxin